MRILIIEDEQKHRDDAKKFFSRKDEVETIYAFVYREAFRHMRPPQGKTIDIDGVISDLYFPLSFDGYWTQEEALGVNIMIICRERRIPCVLNIAGYHHGKRYQWVCDLQRFLNLPELVDATGNYYNDAPSKNWQLAFERLERLIKRGPCSKHNAYDGCIS